MKIGTAIATATALRITNRFGRLGIRVNLGQTTTPVLTGNLLTELNLIKTSLELQNGSGSQIVMQETPLGDLFQLALLNGGHFVHELVGAESIVTCLVEITNEGTLRQMNNDAYVLNLSGTFGNNTIDIYAIDFPMESKVLNFHERITLDANSSQEISVSDATFLAIPKASLDTVEFLYSNNSRCKYLPIEIDFMSRDGIGMLGIDKGLVVTAPDLPLIFLPVANVYSVTLAVSSAVTVYKVIPKQLV